MLYRLIYASTAKALEKRNIEDILNVAERHNAAHGLTGALIFNTRFFMQLLEGEQAEVEALYARICEDPRHKDVRTISAHPVDERLFADWSMRYFGERDLPDDMLGDLFPGAVFRAQDATEETSLKLLRHLATVYGAYG